MKATEETYKGFLISCDKNREREALKDAYNFLEQYVHRLYSDVTEESIVKKLKREGKELNLQNEVRQRKANEHKLLVQVDTNVNCLCFIKINPVYKQVDPLVVVAEIMRDVHQEGRSVTRFCHRILPVEKAFKAEHFRMIQEIDELLYIHTVPNEIKSWRLNFKCRNNNKFNYKEVLKQVELLTKKYHHFPDIYYPQWTISVEITNHLMCLSISDSFKETNQFKLHPLKTHREATAPHLQQSSPKYPAEHAKQTKKKNETVAEPERQKAADEQGMTERKLLDERFQKKQDDVDLL